MTQNTKRQLIIMHPGSENTNTTNRRDGPEDITLCYVPIVVSPNLVVPTSNQETSRFISQTLHRFQTSANAFDQTIQLRSLGHQSGETYLSSLHQLPVMVDTSDLKPSVGESVDTRAGTSPRFKFVNQSIIDGQLSDTRLGSFTRGSTPVLTRSADLHSISKPFGPILKPDIKNPPEAQETERQNTKRQKSPVIDTLYHSESALPDRRNRSRESKRPSCRCKNSLCIRLYCDCFTTLDFCSKDCTCTNCMNNEKNTIEREQVIQDTLAKNPQAFTSKYKKINKDKKVLLHTRGCHCKKTGCVKQYCECYKAKTGCTRLCRCIACKNEYIDLSPEEVRANYQKVQRKRRRSPNPFKLYATKAAANAEKQAKK